MAELNGQISFDELGIAAILRRFRLVVPPNQREYSWKKKHVTTLFQDLQKALQDEQAGAYFLGTVVTISKSEDILEVVDGQQRLATTAILLTEIRNHLRVKAAKIAEHITNHFLQDIDTDRQEYVTKLRLNTDDNEFFSGMVSAPKPSGCPEPELSSHHLLEDAFKEARKHVKRIVAGLDDKDHGQALNRWIKYLEFHARVILLKVGNAANAYKMFETLNDRGLETSQADLVKNFVFEKSGDRLPEAQQRWTRMRGSLESLDDEDITVKFLRQAMIVIRGHLRQDQVYEQVQTRITGPGTAIQLLSELESLAGIYVATFNPEHERWNAYPDTIRRGIETLNLLNIRIFRPLMLATGSQFAPNESAEAYRMLISLGVRLMIASNTSRGAVEEPLANAGHKVFAGEITTTKQLRKVLSQIIPSDEDFQRAFETATVSKAALARYYLRSLEMAAKDEPVPWFIPNDDRQAINLEHVLPERCEGGQYPDFEDEEARRAFVRRIGNMVLLKAKSNSELRSEDFDTKRAAYGKSPYELTRQVAKLGRWGPTQVTSRQLVLAELALQAWPL